MTLTSRDLLKAQKKAQIIKRRRHFSYVVKLDLASREITDREIDFDNTGMKMNVTEAKDAILGWTWTVTLKSGDVLTYTMDNADDAPVMCGDVELQLVDPTPAPEE